MRPGARVGVHNALLSQQHRFVRMAAVHAIGAARPGIRHGSGGHLGRQTLPARIELVQHPGRQSPLGIQLLNGEIDLAGQAVEQEVIPDDEMVELVPVNRQVPDPAGFPGVFSVGRDSHQVGHDVDQPVIVVSLDPDHIHLPLRVRQFPDVGEKIPVFPLQPPEIEVAEDVAEQDEAPELDRLQQFESLARPGDLRPQVQVGEDHHVIGFPVHDWNCGRGLWGSRKGTVKVVQKRGWLTLS